MSEKKINHCRLFRLSVFPEKGPEIIGLSSHYAVGENVTAKCTSSPSVPKANLRWTINGDPVKYFSFIRARDMDTRFHSFQPRHTSSFIILHPCKPQNCYKHNPLYLTFFFSSFNLKNTKSISNCFISSIAHTSHSYYIRNIKGKLSPIR